MRIMGTNTPVEAHYSIAFVKYYHNPLYQIYCIITTKFPGIKFELTFQISFKVLNDLIGPNGLILALLMFGVYSHMTNIDIYSPTIN